MEPCVIIYVALDCSPPPLSPRVPQDSVLEPHTQVNACFERIGAQRTLDHSGMDVSYVLPSQCASPLLSCPHPDSLSSF